MSGRRIAIALFISLVILAVATFAILSAWNPLASPTRPKVSIKNPYSNTTVMPGAEVKVEVAVEGSNIQRTELHADQKHASTAINPTPGQSFLAQMTWKAEGAGQHTLAVYAYGADGLASEPAGIIIIVETPATGTPTPAPESTKTPTVGASPTQAVLTPTITTTPTSLPTVATPPPPLAPPLPPIATVAPPPPPAPMPETPAVPSIPVAPAEPSCPGPPIIGDFGYVRTLIFPPDPKATLVWGPVQNATEISIDQGIGPVTAPGSTVVQPMVDTTYTLTATGCGGTLSKAVTVVAILPPTPSPTATLQTIITSTQPGPVLPLIPATVIVAMPVADLEVTSITVWQAVGAPKGDILVQITNRGPAAVSNLPANLDCSAEQTAWVGGAKTALAMLRPLSLTLGVNQSATVEAGLQATDIAKYWYKVTCTLKANTIDSSPSNNTKTVNIPQP